LAGNKANTAADEAATKNVIHIGNTGFEPGTFILSRQAFKIFDLEFAAF
jgi:hypothetical protein